MLATSSVAIRPSGTEISGDAQRIGLDLQADAPCGPCAFQDVAAGVSQKPRHIDRLARGIVQVAHDPGHQVDPPHGIVQRHARLFIPHKAALQLQQPWHTVARLFDTRC